MWFFFIAVVLFFVFLEGAGGEEETGLDVLAQIYFSFQKHM